jgi:hypothetical protein
VNDKIAIGSQTESYVPPHVDVEVEVATTDEAINLVPWAWYALGWHGETLSVWLAFAKAFVPDSALRPVFRAIPASSYCLRHALNVLGGQVPVRVGDRIRENCDQLERMNGIDAGGPAPLGAGSKNSFESAGTLCDEIRSIVLGLDTSTTARPWLTFGRQLGAWYRQEQFSDRPIAESAEQIVAACHESPQSDRSAVPLLEQLAALAEEGMGEPDRLVPEVFRLLVPKREEWEGYPAVSLFRGVFSFALEIHSCLLRYPHLRTPRWVKDGNKGVLWFGETVARVVPKLKQSPNLVKVLDAFAEEGWPEWIDSPLKDSSPVLHTTLNQLRNGLTGPLCFRSDGTGEQIGWHVQPPLSDDDNSFSLKADDKSSSGEPSPKSAPRVPE